MFKFHGNADHSPMAWDVIEGDDGRWLVVESYDDWKSFIVNTDVESEQAGWDFVSAWFAQFYE